MDAQTRYPMRKTYVVRVGGARYGSVQHVPEWRSDEATKALADAYLADVQTYFDRGPEYGEVPSVEMIVTNEPDAYLRAQDEINYYDR